MILVLLGTVAYADVQPTNDDSLKQRRSRGGRVKISNSRGGKAILGCQAMGPGNSGKGSVVIGNKNKKRKARFFLAMSNLVDSPGNSVGRLSYRLVLKVQRISNKRRPQTVYYGPLRDLPMVGLGVFKPREKRTYLFTMTFADRGAALDNAYQTSSTSVTFNWYARPAR